MKVGAGPLQVGLLVINLTTSWRSLSYLSSSTAAGLDTEAREWEPGARATKGLPKVLGVPTLLRRTPRAKPRLDELMPLRGSDLHHIFECL
jgi:hypothetical protein